jgi:HSP20 family molecular chaperone IbpA
MADRTEKEARRESFRTPLVDIFETGDGVTFQFEMPGVSRDEIDINVDGDSLRVKSRAQIKEDRHGKPVFREFAPANFEREFLLSRDLDRGKMDASWRDGVLTLKVPKAEAAKPRKISISAT